jgi:hypothetical protein
VYHVCQGTEMVLVLGRNWASVGSGARRRGVWCPVEVLLIPQIYAFGGAASVAFVYFLIPETQGRTLEEIK